ncbi:MAG: hypothetical protein LCH54_17775 [Bacteroidetes bacterium]|nr:hypothetical protein [Bacteroidota bacterium]
MKLFYLFFLSLALNISLSGCKDDPNDEPNGEFYINYAVIKYNDHSVSTEKIEISAAFKYFPEKPIVTINDSTIGLVSEEDGYFSLGETILPYLENGKYKIQVGNNVVEGSIAMSSKPYNIRVNGFSADSNGNIDLPVADNYEFRWKCDKYDKFIIYSDAPSVAINERPLQTDTVAVLKKDQIQSGFLISTGIMAINGSIRLSEKSNVKTKLGNGWVSSLKISKVNLIHPTK